MNEERRLPSRIGIITRSSRTSPRSSFPCPTAGRAKITAAVAAPSMQANRMLEARCWSWIFILVSQLTSCCEALINEILRRSLINPRHLRF